MKKLEGAALWFILIAALSVAGWQVVEIVRIVSASSGHQITNESENRSKPMSLSDGGPGSPPQIVNDASE